VSEVGRRRRRDRDAGARRRSNAGAVGRRRDAGAAVVEFVLLGVVLLVPLAYLALVVSAVQRSLHGVTQAAREAGRAYATGTAGTAAARATYAARLALEDQGLPADGVQVRYGPATGSCADASAAPAPLVPGAVFAVCVTRPLAVPGVPGVVTGERTTVTGRFVVHVDRYRDTTRP
jgi:Flp pilus assembly protein TadG